MRALQPAGRAIGSDAPQLRRPQAARHGRRRQRTQATLRTNRATAHSAEKPNASW